MALACVGSFAGRDKRPIVEFALESAQAVRKMATKQAWQKTQVQGQAHHLHQGPGPAIAAYAHCLITYSPGQARLYGLFALTNHSCIALQLFPCASQSVSSS